MVWDRRPERDAGARDRHAGAAHSCDAGRSGRPAQPGRERFGALERKSGTIRQSHAPRLRTFARYRQGGKAEARVTVITAASVRRSGSRTSLLDRPGAVADHTIARTRGVSRVAQRKPLRREVAAARLHQEAGHREIPTGLVGAEAFPVAAFDGGGGGAIEAPRRVIVVIVRQVGA